MTSTDLPSGTRLAHVSDPGALAGVLGEIGLRPPQPVIVLIGGAARLDAALHDTLYRIVRDGVLAVAGERGAAVIDGGTDSGVMALAGRGRAESGSAVPVIGVAPRGRVTAPGLDGAGTTQLEPNHSHMLLVPGDEWGAESPWLVQTARLLAGDRPVVAVVLDGGPVALTEAMACAAEGWPIITLAGSGRSADVLARYAGGAAEPELATTERRGIHACQLTDGSPALASMLRTLLDGGEVAATRPQEPATADYPALYLAASDAARRGQSIHKRLSLGEILLTSSGLSIALIASLLAPGEVLRLVVGAITALVFLTALVLKFISRSSGFDADWYNGRALAETVKSTAWRYMMRVSPFAGPDADRRFRRELRKLLRRTSGFRQAIDRLPPRPQQISDKMRAVRQLPVTQRRDFYISARVRNQADWYRRKAAHSIRWAGRWYWASIIFQLIAATFALLTLGTIGLAQPPEILRGVVAAWPPDFLRLIALFGALALAMTAWSQLNRYDELGRSYATVYHELLLIENAVDEVRTEAELDELVGDAEDAIGREHRLWVAKRGAPLSEEEPGEDELEEVTDAGPGNGG